MRRGATLFRKKLRRDHVLWFLAEQPACTVAMEACAGSHYWAREIAKLGHGVWLIAPGYVKPFVKRQTIQLTRKRSAKRPRGRPCGSWP